jgi:restriction system protein
VFEEVEWVADRLEAIAADALVRFPGSRALFIASNAPPIGVDALFAFNREFFGRNALAEPVTQSSLTRLAPSIGVLQKLQRKLIALDDLSWREFEQLIARMLETDGYKVELMGGSKDGGDTAAPTSRAAATPATRTLVIE